jgi:hypothetical protein
VSGADRAAAPGRRVAPTIARGWVSLYVVAFVLMLGAGACLALAVRSFLTDMWPLWLSVALSSTAIVTAVLGLLLPRRP